MSRIGKKPVPIVGNAKVTLSDQLVRVEGPKGKLEFQVHPSINVRVDEGSQQVVVTRANDEKQSRALHGLTRSIVANMIAGATEGYRKVLEVHGVGYRAELRGRSLVLSVGFANQITLQVPEGLTASVEGNKIVITGPDKQQVGQFASDVRRVRKPEPYKGKGIRYEGEAVRLKAGKAFAGAGAK